MKKGKLKPANLSDLRLGPIDCKSRVVHGHNGNKLNWKRLVTISVDDGVMVIVAAIYTKENLLNNVISVIPPNLNRGEWVATLPRALVVVNDIHKRGGTILGTSRIGYETSKIVDSIQDRGINQVYIIGGDGTQKGASVIYEEIRRRGLRVSVIGIPKTIDNDILVIDKSFGFDSAVEEAQRAIRKQRELYRSGQTDGKVQRRDVDCCLILESPFYLEGPGGLFDYIEKRLKENGHMVIVIAEGAGQELSKSLRHMHQQDASGNKLLHDVGL
ncbi:hypothetical protein ACFE04_023464 [Oxalis oulophora]